MGLPGEHTRRLCVVRVADRTVDSRRCMVRGECENANTHGADRVVSYVTLALVPVHAHVYGNKNGKKMYQQRGNDNVTGVINER